jgi:hypothetical protein
MWVFSLKSKVKRLVAKAGNDEGCAFSPEPVAAGVSSSLSQGAQPRVVSALVESIPIVRQRRIILGKVRRAKRRLLGGGAWFGNGQRARWPWRLPRSENRDPSASSGRALGHPPSWNSSAMTAECCASPPFARHAKAGAPAPSADFRHPRSQNRDLGHPILFLSRPGAAGKQVFSV